MKKFFKIKKFKQVALLTVFLSSFLVYLFTLCPTIGLEDSAEFVTTAATLGIPHPPGFPLYSITGFVFTKLVPFGILAFKVNLMSAFFGALTCSLLFLIILGVVKLIGHRKDSIFNNQYFILIALASSLSLAFSHTFWSQSIIAEVYTLNSFFVALLVWLLLKWTISNTEPSGGQTIKVEKYLYFFSFIYGLSLTNHTMMILLAPVFSIYILLIGGKKLLKNYKLIISLLFVFLTPLFLYLYLPFRALTDPVLNWGHLDSLSRLWQHVSRAQYNDFSLISDGNRLLLVQSFFTNLAAEFNFLTVLLGLIGFILLFIKKNSKLGFLFVGIFLFNSVVIVMLRKLGWALSIERVYSVYYLPSNLALILGFAFAMNWLLERINNFKKEYFKKVILVITLLFLVLNPIYLFHKNYQNNNYKNFNLVDQWARQTLQSLEENAVLITKDFGLTGDARQFALAYFDKVEKIRPDITVLGNTCLFKMGHGWNLPLEYYEISKFSDRKKYLVEYCWRYHKLSGRPLYTTFSIDTPELTSRSNGMVYQIFSQSEAPDNLPLNYSIDESKIDFDNYDLVAKSFLANHYYALATNLYESRDMDYINYLLKAIDYDESPFSQEYQAFINHRALLIKKFSIK